MAKRCKPGEFLDKRTGMCVPSGVKWMGIILDDGIDNVEAVVFGSSEKEVQDKMVKIVTKDEPEYRDLSFAEVQDAFTGENDALTIHTYKVKKK